MNILIIAYNKYKAFQKHRFYHVTRNTKGFSDVKMLKSKPLGKYDEVWETGEGDYNTWNEHLAVKLKNHNLIKK